MSQKELQPGDEFMVRHENNSLSTGRIFGSPKDSPDQTTVLYERTLEPDGKTRIYIPRIIDTIYTAHIRKTGTETPVQNMYTKPLLPMRHPYSHYSRQRTYKHSR